MNSLRVILFMLLTFSSSQALSVQLQIVTHPDVNQQSVSLNRLRGIFSMRHRKWEDGTLIRVFVLQGDNELHAKFCTNILGILPHQLKRAWSRLVYSGTGQAPFMVSSEQEMQNKVAETPGAIGYISTSNSQGVSRLELK